VSGQLENRQADGRSGRQPDEGRTGYIGYGVLGVLVVGVGMIAGVLLANGVFAAYTLGPICGIGMMFIVAAAYNAGRRNPLMGHEPADQDPATH